MKGVTESLGLSSKGPPSVQEMQVQPLGQKDPQEKELATHSSIHAWEMPWTEELGGLQFMGWQEFGHDLAIKPPPLKLCTSLFVLPYLPFFFFFFESCELSFIGGKMRTADWEAASQIALKDCSKAAVRESLYIRFW